MAELKFIITADNSGMMESLTQTQDAMRKTAQAVEQIGDRLKLDEFKDAASAVDDFSKSMYSAGQETVNTLSSMSQEFASQASSIRAEMEQMMGGGSMVGMSEKLEDYKEAVIGASATAQAAYEQQAAAVDALSNELESLQQAQEAAFSAGDSGTAQALQGDIDELTSTLSQAQEKLGELGAQAEAANFSLKTMDATFQEFGGGAQNLTQLWGDVANAMKEATKSATDWATGNGKFTEGLNQAKTALSGMGGAFTPAIAGAKKFITALRAMIATPIGAVLTVVVLALQSLHKWFTKSAEGQKAFAKVSAFVSSILSSISDIAVAVGKYLFRAFTDPNKPLGAFARNLVGTFSNALKSVYHLVKGLGQSLSSLGTIIKGIGTMSLDTISAGWENLKNAGTLMGQAFKEAGQAASNAFSTIVNGVKGVVGAVGDMASNISLDGLASGVTNAVSKAQEAARLAGQWKEEEIALSEAQAKQAEYEKQIGEQYEKLYKLKGKEKQDAINELKELQKAKYDDLITAQTKLYEIQKKNNSLHSSTLEDLQKERDLRVQVLQTEAQRANATRMLARMEANTEKQVAASASKSAKATATTKKNDVRDAKATAEAIAAAAEVERKATKDRVDAAQKMEEAIANARIDAMKDGAEKVKAQRDAELKKELLDLADKRDAAVEAEYQRQMAEYNANAKALKAQGQAVKEWDASMFDESEKQKIIDWYEELARLIQEKQRNVIEQEEKSAMREYLINYGTYQERRLAIADEYAEKIAKATTEGDKLLLTKQRESAYNNLDKEFGLQAQQMADLFGDASEKSVNAIEAIIGKYKALVNFMQGNGVERYDLLHIGFSEEDIRKVQTGEIKINDIIEAIKKLENELNRRSPFKAFADELDKALGSIDEGKLGEGLQGIGSAVNKFLPKVKEFSKNIANIFGYDDSQLQGVIDAVGGLGEAAAGVGQVMTGDIVGGLMTAASGISKIVSGIEGLFGADYSSYEKLVEQYDKLIDVWDDLLDKKKEYLNTSYGGEALRTEQEITDILNRETEAWRELGKERLNAGASAGSHSIGKRIIKEMTAADWGAIDKALGTNAKNLLGQRLTGLFDLSSSQLSRLKEQAPAFWARMDDDVRKYLQNIIDGAEQLEDVQQQAKERLTQTTFDAVRDDFINKLADMETAAADFSDDFSKMLFTAMLNTKINDLFADRLEDWYNNFAKSMEDSELTQGERNSLLNEWEGIVNDSLKLRDSLAEATGYAQSMSEGSGAYKAASSFSQEQGDELNGRLTAIQIGQALANEQLLTAVMTLQGLSVVVQTNGTTLSEMRNLMLIGNGHLEDIARYTRIASQYGDAIETIATKIKDL